MLVRGAEMTSAVSFRSLALTRSGPVAVVGLVCFSCFNTLSTPMCSFLIKLRHVSADIVLFLAGGVKTALNCLLRASAFCFEFRVCCLTKCQLYHNNQFFCVLHRSRTSYSRCLHPHPHLLGDCENMLGVQYEVRVYLSFQVFETSSDLRKVSLLALHVQSVYFPDWSAEPWTYQWTRVLPSGSLCRNESEYCFQEAGFQLCPQVLDCVIAVNDRSYIGNQVCIQA